MDIVRPLPQSQLSAFAATEVEDGAPSYRDVPLHHGTSEVAFETLGGIDWAFTEDDTRFLGHDLHPYPAKFIPQLPGTLISHLSCRGELVFDPFGGSGTTALEAVRLGRRAVSFDANPVAALIGRVKTAQVGPKSLAELHRLHGALRTISRSLPVEPSELVEKYEKYAPDIANRQKWFSDEAFGELAHIRYRILNLSEDTARDVAFLAMSRSVLASSFQDSETRYKSVPRPIAVGETTRRFVREFEAVMRSVARNAAATRYGQSQFLVGDVRDVSRDQIEDSSVDLIVTSPPYGNAMDYHLYHRFRLLWLGYDPIAFGKIEIGSHLKHQREGNGFQSYFSDMQKAAAQICRVLKNGRYAALVIGDSIYDGQRFDTAELLGQCSADLGFDAWTVLKREVHKSKRSFTAAGRRASTESILVLRKADRLTKGILSPPPYKLYPYEQVLRKTENAAIDTAGKGLTVPELARCRSLVFTHAVKHASGFTEPTWQAILENGSATSQSARKDPKYVTHGIHSYKGKFYPQLAKGLINRSGVSAGARILDPFCGSGTTLLEGYLNGYETFGCDLHPLAAKIAKAKTAVLEEDPDVLSEVVSGMYDAIQSGPDLFPSNLDEFSEDCQEEVAKWFPEPVARKLNWLLKTIRAGSEGACRDFLEVVLSSIIRDVSQQEPTDLRIRYRKKMLEDADVLGLFGEQLVAQFARIEKFWKVRTYAPHSFIPSKVVPGDNRHLGTYRSLGIEDESIDLILTSPPYAMALPYIDTDRLSLLTLFSMSGSARRPIEQSLTGSREISLNAKRKVESDFQMISTLPTVCTDFVLDLHERLANSASAGFRKQNMPALIHRFLSDMDDVFANLFKVCRSGAEAMVVIGDSKMTVDEQDLRIPTTDFVEAIAVGCGFEAMERLDISVTTENLLHIKNAITENVVLRLRKA